MGGGTKTVAGAIVGIKRLYIPSISNPPYLKVLEGVGNFFQEVSDKKQRLALALKQHRKIEDQHIDQPDVVQEKDHSRKFGHTVKGKGDRNRQAQDQN